MAHVRDIFLDKSYRQENGRKGFYSTLYSTTSYVEDIMQEMNGAEFKESISELLAGFSGVWQGSDEFDESEPYYPKERAFSDQMQYGLF